MLCAKFLRPDCLIGLLEWPSTHDFQGHNVFLFSQHTNTVYSLLSFLISIHLRPHFHVQWIVHFSNQVFLVRRSCLKNCVLNYVI